MTSTVFRLSRRPTTHLKLARHHLPCLLLRPPAPTFAQRAASSVSSVSTSHVVRPKPAEGLTEDELIERQRAQAEIAQRHDFAEAAMVSEKSMRMPLMAVAVPVRWKDLPPKAGVGTSLRWARGTFVNWFGNGMSAIGLARDGLLPLETQPKGIWSIWCSPTKANISGPASWMGPFTHSALQTYKDINDALARGDRTALRDLCRDEYLQLITRRIHARPKDVSMLWQFHGEAAPTRCVSLRQARVPTTASSEFRLAQAVVRFDTMQTLQVRDLSKAGRKKAAPPVPEPKRVVEYLVFEGRLTDDPLAKWLVRNQLWEDPSQFVTKPAAAG